MAITNIPFFPDSLDCGKVYRSPMPNARDLERYSSEFKITTIVQLCFDREFSTYGKENVLKLREEKEFKVIRFPIEDFKVPKSKADTREMVDRIIGLIKGGENVVIHCVGGNGRTGLMLACLARRIFDFDGPEAVRWVRKFVSTAVERSIQEKFVATYLEDDEEVKDSFEDSYSYRTTSFKHHRPMPSQRSAQIVPKATIAAKENDFPSRDDDEWEVYPKSSQELGLVVTPKPSSSTGSTSSLALVIVDTPSSAEKANASVQPPMTSLADASSLPKEEEKAPVLSDPVLDDSRHSPRKKKKRPVQSPVDSSESADKPVRLKKKESGDKSSAKTKPAEKQDELVEVIVEVPRNIVEASQNDEDYEKKSGCFTCCTIQ